MKIKSAWRTSVSPHRVSGKLKRAGKRYARTMHKSGKVVIAKGDDAIAMLSLIQELKNV